MGVAEVLRAAASLVESGWCQKAMATDASGRPVPEDDDTASCFCALGAVIRAADYDSGVYMAALDRFCEFIYAETGHFAVSRWNDTPGRTAEDVAARLRECAGQVEGKASR